MRSIANRGLSGRRGVLALATTLAIPFLASAPAGAGDVLCLWTAPKGSGFGETGVVFLGDWNGNGAMDVAIQEALDSTHFPNGGAVRVYEVGACGTVLFTAFGQAPDEGYGRPIGPGDFTGDGLGDLAVVTQIDSTLVQGGGRLDVYAGGTGTLLFTYHGAFQWQALGFDAAALGDVDVDGFPDFAVGAPNARQNSIPFGHVLVFSGATGQVIHDLWGTGSEQQLGWAVAGPGDVDGDGHADVAAGAPTTNAPTFFGEVVVFSGVSGNPIWSVQGTTSKQALGAGLRAVGDADGDGVGELLVTNGLGGGMQLVSAANGSVKKTWSDLSASSFGMAGPGDLTGDGIADLVVPLPPPLGGNQVLRGGDFAPLARLEWGLVNAAGDADQDGFGDYAVVQSSLQGTTAWLFSGRCDGVDPFGTGCAGGTGGAPRLMVLGPCDLRPNVTLTLVVQGAAPNQPALLVFGQAPANVPLGGCVLQVAPLVGPLVAFQTGTNGDGFLNAPIPPGLSGLSAHMQAFVADPQAPAGFSGTNGLTLHFP